MVYRALPWPYSLLPLDGQHNLHIGVMFQFCQNYIVCDHWSITMHAFINQTCMVISSQKINKSDIIWLSNLFTNLIKMFNSFLTLPMHGTSSKYAIPRNHISKWHLVNTSEHLNAPTFCKHVKQTNPHKSIWLQTMMNDLVMNTPAVFKHNHDGTSCIQHTHKINGFGCTVSCLSK